MSCKMNQILNQRQQTPNLMQELEIYVFWGHWKVPSSSHGPRGRKWVRDTCWQPYGDPFSLC